MRITSFNIQFCRGRDDRFDTARVVDAIRASDIVALQEVEVGWDRSDNRDQPADIAAMMPGHFWAYHPTVDVLKDASLDAGRAVERRRQFGNMILSRWPLVSVRRFLLPRFTAFADHTIQRGVIEAVIDAPGGRFRFYSTHLCHLSEEARREQVLHMRRIHRDAPSEGAPTFGPHSNPVWAIEAPLPAAPAEAIICGDMNFRPDSPAHQAMVGERHVPSGRRLTALGGFVDGWESAGASDDPGHTLYRDFVARDGIRIDYVFLSTGIAHRLQRVWVDRDCEASDHQPVHAELADG